VHEWHGNCVENHIAYVCFTKTKEFNPNDAIATKDNVHLMGKCRPPSPNELQTENEKLLRPQHLMTYPAWFPKYRTSWQITWPMHHNKGRLS